MLQPVSTQPIRIKDGDHSIYSPFVTEGATVRYKGRDYVIVPDMDKTTDVTPALRAQQKQTGLSASFWGVIERFQNMWDDFSPRSFETDEARLSRLLTTPEQRKLLVDVDSTLWYKDVDSKKFEGVLAVDRIGRRGGLLTGDCSIDVDALLASGREYMVTNVSRDGQSTEVIVSLRMLKFLKDQSHLGVPICITSTGKTDRHDDAKYAQSLQTLFARCKIYTGEGAFQFQNYEDLKAEYRKKGSRFPMIKMFLKYMTKGDFDKDNPNRRHIMVEDKWYHQWGWKQPAIDSAHLGMGKR